MTEQSEPIYLATFAPGDPDLMAEIEANHPHAVTRTLDDGRVAVFVLTGDEDVCSVCGDPASQSIHRHGTERRYCDSCGDDLRDFLSGVEA